METTLHITDVTCSRCSERIEAVLSRLAGVHRVEVDWRSGEARIHHAPTVRTEALIATVERASAGTRHRYRVTSVQQETPALHPTLSEGGTEMRKKGPLSWLGALVPLLLCLPCVFSVLLTVGIGLLGTVASALAGAALISLLVALGTAGAAAVLLVRRVRQQGARMQPSSSAICACEEPDDRRADERTDAGLAVSER